MNDGMTDIRTAEYESLRQEILQNRQFIFERPLIIIAAAGIAALQMSENTSMLALPPLVIFVLCANLWFTVNRIHSLSRIVGYITVIHEPETQHSWIGWENALRLHRKWRKTHKPQEKKDLIRPYLDEDVMPDSMMFYPMILSLHIVPVVFALAAFLLTLRLQHPRAEGVMLVITILATGCFAYLCLWPCRPTKMIHLIEEQRATWLAVFSEKTGDKSNADYES